MHSKNTIRTISLIGTLVLAATTARAVDPPPDGGYPNQNTAEGEDALFTLTTGVRNTTIGFNALYRNATGSDNTASGNQALFANSRGGGNTATGSNALLSNTTGGFNTANGFDALEFNTTGLGNTACGVEALTYNTTGNLNTATGYLTLPGNTGNNNTADGCSALTNNGTGNNNTAIGNGALAYNTAGDSNIALGDSAGKNVTTGNFNIDIGNHGVAADTQTIRIGKTQRAAFIAGVSGATVPGGIPVIVDSTGHLGTVTSSARYKQAIKPMDKASEAILALQPVTFHYKKELDPAGIPQFGLVAEQVEKVNPDLVVRDDEGKAYTVRYEAVNAMLLNEFLKEHCKVQTLETTVARVEEDFRARSEKQEGQIESLKAALKEQAATIQKVSGSTRNEQIFAACCNQWRPRECEFLPQSQTV